MFIRILLIFFCLSMMIASAKANMDDGLTWYNARHENSNGIIASVENISKAIDEFLLALKSQHFEKEAAIYLLKSYYFLAEYAINDKMKKKELFNIGKNLGIKYISKYPNSVDLRYWYLVNLGSWAQVYGIIAAAREGVADQMKLHSEKIIALDPNYQNGGGYFMLGAVHYKSPYIPFLLPWPDNKEAVKYLQKSHNVGIATLNQKNYLAQALHKSGQIYEAKEILNEVINSIPDTLNLVEDLNDIYEAKNLLKDF